MDKNQFRHLTLQSKGIDYSEGNDYSEVIDTHKERDNKVLKRVLKNILSGMLSTEDDEIEKDRSSGKLKIKLKLELDVIKKFLMKSNFGYCHILFQF